MSIAHTNAALECDQFRGNARLLLVALAYYAYDKGPYPKGFPDPGFGWLYRDEEFFMGCLNITRRQTISGCYSELAQAGVIRRKRRWHNSWLTFVDLEWLKSHARPQVTENVACEKEHATESVTSVPTDNVTCPQRKTLRSSTESVTTSTSTVLRGSASSSSIKSNPLTTMIAPQVLPQADPKAKPTTPGPLMNKYAPRRQPQPPAKPEPEDEGDSFEIDEQDDGLSWTGPELDFEDDGLSSAQSRSVSDPLPIPPAPLPKPKPTPAELEQRHKDEKEAELLKRRAAEITAYFAEEERKRLAGEPAYGREAEEGAGL
jgi:hypothetical protein